MKRLFGKIYKRLKKTSRKKWEDIEYFNSDWKSRIEVMSKFIEPGLSVTDLGCGKMWLKEFINNDNNYVPVDYISRGTETIVCDFNKHEYSNIKTEIAFVSGCLEYVNDYEWFVEKISYFHNKCILSYCTIENFPDVKERKMKTWVNNLSESQIIVLFEKNGFTLIEKLSSSNVIFVFEK